MTIETENLRIIALSHLQLVLWMGDLPQLERDLGCEYCGEPMDGHFAQFLRGHLPKMAADSENWLFETFWWIICKADAVAIGSLGFKGIANDLGEIEIGYGLGEDWRGRGYMAEALAAICDFAKAQSGIKCVIAETEPNNPKSENVLKRCGFMIYDKKDDNLWWRL